MIKVFARFMLTETCVGHGKNLRITFEADSSVSVEHDGRSLPLLASPTNDTLTLEQALTEVSEPVRKVPTYWTPSHLQLTGVNDLALTNALSSWLRVEGIYEGQRFQQSYVEGVPQAPLGAMSAAVGQGLRIHFRPDPTIFVGDYDFEQIAVTMNELAYLHGELCIHLRDDRPGHTREQRFHFEQGLTALAQAVCPDRTRALTELITIASVYETGEVHAVLQFFNKATTTLLCYANDQSTPRGGAHADGLLTGVTRVLSRIARAEGLLQQDEDDICRYELGSGVLAIINVQLDSLTYGDNMKASVTNPEVRAQVLWLVELQLDAYFAEHLTHARVVIDWYLRQRSWETRLPASVQVNLELPYIEYITHLDNV